MKKIVPVVVLFFACTQLQGQTASQNKALSAPDKPDTKEPAKIKAANIERAAKTQFQYFVIKADSSTYGYSIYADGNLYIYQPTMPAIGGNKGFADTASAGKCAQLVIQKIKQGEIPPSLTVEELKQNSLIKQ
jgi:Domain of unknown function (DUF4907)